MNRVAFVIFSGLPGSGKSTLASQIAPALGLVLLDKDDFLNALFETHGVGDAEWRMKVSREADAQFADAARRVSGACLVSWWRHPSAGSSTSGTPTEWLTDLPHPVAEVHCHCDREVALARFRERRRHAGHLDAQRTTASLRDQFSALVAAPLGCGPVVTVRTDEPIVVAELATRLRESLSL